MERLAQFQRHIVPNKASQRFDEDNFAHLQLAPPDPILGLSAAYNTDKFSKKVNLGVGAYRTDAGKPYVFKAVKKAEQEIVNDPAMNKEYAPIDGVPALIPAARNLMFGAGSAAVRENRIVSSQTISGTGSLRVLADFLFKYRKANFYLPAPTWGNHLQVFKASGFNVKEYTYYNPRTKGLDFEGMINSLNNVEPGSIVLLHVCAHNPTGVDPTPDQWVQIAAVLKKRDLFPFFDSAYQGFASGDLEKDAFSVRHFIEQGFQMVVSQSFAKNMGLYGERCGLGHIVCRSADTAKKAQSQLKMIVRAMYSSPPIHGARIAAKILNSQSNFNEWAAELKEVSERIIQMRFALKKELIALGTPGNWDHITNQIGMFSYTGMNAKQCEHLIKKWHIYLVKNGRISMAGVNSGNVRYIAEAMKDAITNAN